MAWTPTWTRIPWRPSTVPGGCSGTAQFPADRAGYAGLLSWLRGFGALVLVGIEGTGAYGAGLTRHLQAEQVELVEVDRPTARPAGRASPIRSTRKLPPGPRWPGRVRHTQAP